MNKSPFSQVKAYHPYRGLYDPCPPIEVKYYSTPPNLYLGFQPANLPQYAPLEALYKGTLWPIFYDEYPMKIEDNSPPKGE
ncbi:spore coat associated protein CotJA [Bacillus carboniphilus]|uniref:Spore coat associated protein CotJA n=1 Tax=Bacillus carboniphilus TaxID=86663 RepID=A0ABY9K0H4_9BACI|nr:spore coat associated protein CotJA [Bacillus carboniphilus]WLR43355.1 spore coat associated protein CotJA [Bacillus carboniphilus]